MMVHTPRTTTTPTAMALSVRLDGDEAGVIITFAGEEEQWEVKSVSRVCRHKDKIRRFSATTTTANNDPMSSLLEDAPRTLILMMR